MAQTYSGMILYKKDQRSLLVPLGYALSLADLQTYALKLVGLTNAQTYSVSFIVTEDELGILEIEGAAIEEIGIKAKLMLKQTPVEPDVHPWQEINIPAPQMSIFDFIEGQGYRVKQTIGEEVAAAYSAVTGKTYEFQHGWMIGGAL